MTVSAARTMERLRQDSVGALLLIALCFGLTKISSSNPDLTTVWTAYATPPLPAFLHPVVEIAGSGPCG